MSIPKFKIHCIYGFYKNVMDIHLFLRKTLKRKKSFLQKKKITHVKGFQAIGG